jgi:tripartite ATP-independent transporter DctP family solute receptor
MFKKVRSVLPVLLILVFFITCARDNNRIIIKIVSVCPPGNPIVITEHFIKQEIEKQSNGRMQVRIYDSGRLGGETDNIERVRLGTIEMADVSTAVLGNFLEPFFVFDLPFLFDDYDHQKRALTGEVGQYINKELERIGIKGLGYYVSPARNLYTRKPVNAIEDLKGMKIRVMESKIMQQTINSFGSFAIPLSFHELYNALQQDVVDGAENNPSQYLSCAHTDLCKYYTLTEHFRVPTIIVMPLSFYKGLSDENRTIIDRVMQASLDFWDSTAAAIEKEVFEKIKAQGVTIGTIDKAPFRERVRPIYDAFISKYGDGLIKKIEACRIKTAEGEPANQ